MYKQKTQQYGNLYKKSIYMYIERFWKNINQIFNTILGSGAKQNGEEGIREKQNLKLCILRASMI